MQKDDVSTSTIQEDLVQIERALKRIPSHQMRYWIAQFIELLADGVASANARATALSEKHSAERKSAILKIGLTPSVNQAKRELAGRADK